MGTQSFVVRRLVSRKVATQVHSASDILRAQLSPDALEKIRDLQSKQSVSELDFFLTHFASLPRRFRGRANAAPPLKAGEIMLNPSTYHERDFAAALLLADSCIFPDQAQAVEAGVALYNGGDAIERRMLLKALPFIASNKLSETLIMEGHRSNDQSLFEAAFCDTNYPALILNDEDYHNAALKAAFVDIDASRLWGIETRVTTSFSQMLMDLRTEREAASRAPWAGTLQLMAHAPIDGLSSLIRADLTHSDHERRLSAARAACVIRDNDLTDVITAQLEDCQDSELKDLLAAAL